MPQTFGRVLVLAAHPDDEAIACSGLLGRAATSLVVFATDGAAPRYGFERKFGSLEKYSSVRFEEASRALGLIPRCSFQRLARTDGRYFLDQHLFLDFPGAFTALVSVVRAFSPDVLVSHAYEGGHIDHDACHFLAAQTAAALGVETLEFPLYWRTPDGHDVFQQFRQNRSGEFALALSTQELAVKRRMFNEYPSQAKVLSVFHSETERFRPAIPERYEQQPAWLNYPFENRRKFLSAGFFLQRIAEFRRVAGLLEQAEPFALKGRAAGM